MTQYKGLRSIYLSLKCKSEIANESNLRPIQKEKKKKSQNDNRLNKNTMLFLKHFETYECLEPCG